MHPIKRTVRRFALRLLEATDAWEPIERILSEELEMELMRHPGKWTAITHDRLIAVGDTPAAVLEQARAQGEQNAILYSVPLAGTMYVLATNG